MKRLFDNEDKDQKEYNGMKLGDVICTYNAGYHRLDRIERRFCTQEYFDTYYAMKPDTDPTKMQVGDEYSPVMHYTKINPDTGKTSTRYSCDAHWCKLAVPEIDMQIERLQKQRRVLLTFNK